MKKLMVLLGSSIFALSLALPALAREPLPPQDAPRVEKRERKEARRDRRQERRRDKMQRREARRDRHQDRAPGPTPYR